MTPRLYLDRPLARALLRYFHELETRLELRKPVTAYLAGGIAADLYTAARPTGSIDAEFDQRIVVPQDLIVPVQGGEGKIKAVYLDTRYNPMFSLLHEDYRVDAVSVLAAPNEAGLTLKALSPLDLAVSKVARFQGNDREDIAALAQAGLVRTDEIERRANEALAGYIGSPASIRVNLRDALDIVREIEQHSCAEHRG